jgi:carbonic anhydrase
MPFQTRRPWPAREGVLAATGLRAGKHASEQERADLEPHNTEAALARLKSGNRRFVKGNTRHAHQSAEWRKMLAAGQRPFATLLCCSDSRVPPELVFDQGFGDLFVVRVAGNVIATEIIGSIQYAAAHLATPLIVVLGHENCGAVTAALAARQGPPKEPKYIEALVKLIEPGLVQLPSRLRQAELISAAVEANVRWSIRQLAKLPEARRALRRKAITLVGAVYDLKSGRVRFLT